MKYFLFVPFCLIFVLDTVQILVPITVHKRDSHGIYNYNGIPA